MNGTTARWMWGMAATASLAACVLSPVDVSGKACDVDGTCEVGICIQGLCTGAVECSRDVDCGARQACISRACFVPCEVDFDCLVEERCIDLGVCIDAGLLPSE